VKHNSIYNYTENTWSQKKNFLLEDMNFKT